MFKLASAFRFVLCAWVIFVCACEKPTVLHGQDFDYSVFTPLDVGDRWEYVYEEQELPLRHELGDPVVFGYRSFVVTGDTLIDGETYRRIIRRRYDADAQLTEIDSCAARVHVDGGAITYPDLTGACVADALWSRTDFWGSLPPRNSSGSYTYREVIEEIELSIGGSPHENFRIASDYSAGAHAHGWRIFYASGLGLYSWIEEDPPEDPRTPNGWRVSYSLVHAVVGGRSFGESIVASEFPRQMSSQNAVMVYPNPFSNELRVNASGFARMVMVEIYDPLGRPAGSWHRCECGNGALVRIDGSDLASGVYLLRVTDELGQTSSQSIVKL